MAWRGWRTAATRCTIGSLALLVSVVFLYQVLPGRARPDPRWVQVLHDNEAALTAEAETALRTSSTAGIPATNVVFQEVSIRPVCDTDLTVGLGENEDIPPNGDGVYFTLDETGGLRGHLDALYWPEGSGRTRLFACGLTGHGILSQRIEGGWYEEQWVDCDDFLFPDPRSVGIAIVVIGGVATIAAVTANAAKRRPTPEGT